MTNKVKLISGGKQLKGRKVNPVQKNPHAGVEPFITAGPPGPKRSVRKPKTTPAKPRRVTCPACGMEMDDDVLADHRNFSHPRLSSRPAKRGATKKARKRLALGERDDGSGAIGRGGVVRRAHSVFGGAREDRRAGQLREDRSGSDGVELGPVRP